MPPCSVHRRQERPGRAGQRRPGRAAGRSWRPGRLAGLHWHAHRAHARRRRQERQARHHRFRGRQLPRVCSIGALPTQDIGPIIVAECSEVWTWVSTQYYTGYRSPLCGRPVDGHTVTPLASEVDAVGGELSKTDYARLWGMRARIIWWCPMRSGPRTGAHYFADVSGTTFRVPDCEYVPAVYGTDADTANARVLGSKQKGTLTIYPSTGDLEGVCALGCSSPNSKGSIGAESVDLSLVPNADNNHSQRELYHHNQLWARGAVRPENVHFTPGFMYESRHAFGVVRNVDGTSLSRHSTTRDESKLTFKSLCLRLARGKPGRCTRLLFEWTSDIFRLH